LCIRAYPKLTHPFLQPDFFCARPEPVEGFLRALGEILQQVQDEREKYKKEGYLNDLCSIIILNQSR